MAQFLNTADVEVYALDEHGMIIRGTITEWFSPRGLGKTHYALDLAVKLGRSGNRVLLIDRDNSPQEVKRRLRKWGAENLQNLKVMTRDTAPPLTDAAAWKTFPASAYDLVIVDSLDSSAEGIGEKDSAKPSRAIKPILDLAHGTDGPAVLVLGNTIKNATHSRGSGVIEDRADIVFEVRDATDLKPTGTKAWWEELPAAGADAWAKRATRRQQRQKFRLAFVPTKFRVGKEPDPFLIELNLPGNEGWSVRDVTAEVIEAGQEAQQFTVNNRQNTLDTAIYKLKTEIEARFKAGNPMKKDLEAIPFLQDQGLSRAQGRDAITANDGRFWKLQQLKTERGKPVVLFPITGQTKPSTAEIQQSKTPYISTTFLPPISADPDSSGRQKSIVAKPLSQAGFREVPLLPPSQTDQGGDSEPASNSDTPSSDPSATMISTTSAMHPYNMTCDCETCTVTAMMLDVFPGSEVLQ